jgi:CubicO group peptidase (beta-lactamase class C family)
MLTIRRLLTALLFTTILVTAYPQNGRIDKDKLDNRIEQLIDKYHIPSAEATMLINDSLIYNFSNNVSKGRRNYYIGSCSKSFTALTILRLAEKGIILVHIQKTNRLSTDTDLYSSVQEAELKTVLMAF